MSDENVIKVSHRGEVRRVRTDHRLNYEELETLTCKLFPYLSGQTIRLTYRDEDNDHVTFTNDEELTEAYQLNPRLYVRVRTLSSPKTTMRRFVKVTSKPNPNLTVVAEQEELKKEEEEKKTEEAAALVPMPQKFRDSFLALYREGYAPAADTCEALLIAGGCVSTARTALRQALGVDVVAEPRAADAMPDAPLVMSADFTASALKLVAMYGVDRQADVVDALIRYGGNEPNACLSLMNESVCNPAAMRDEIQRALQESAAMAQASRAAEEAAALKERELAVQAALRAEAEAVAKAAAEAKRRQEEAAAAARRREEARRLREEKARQLEELERRAAAEAQAKREAALAEQKRIQAETQRQLEEARAARKHLEEQVREQKSKQLLLSIMASCRFANETAAADYQSKLVLLRDMGFHDLNRSHSALQRHNGDLEKTVEFLTNA